MTEQSDDHYRDLDTWPFEKTLAALVESNRRAVQAVKTALPALTKAAEGIAHALAKGGRLVYIGAGTSGALGLAGRGRIAADFRVRPHRGADGRGGRRGGSGA